MNYLLKKTAWRLVMPLVALTFIMMSCDNKDNKGKESYDPNKPVELTTFHPDSGRIREMVLLDGSNFGTDPSAIKVYFNNAVAKVIGSSGTRILALTPRMPGDTCVLAVVVGKDSVIYPQQKFRYKIEASVTTIAGNGNVTPRIFDQGLDKCQLKPVYIAADKEYNVFVTDDTNVLLRINTVTNTLSVVATQDQGFVARCTPIANPKTNVLQQGAEGPENRDRFSFLDPRDGWALKSKYIKTWDLNGYQLPSGGGGGNLSLASHFQCLYCEADEMYYTRYNGGQIVRVNPETWEAKIIGMTPVGLTYGIAFHPKRPKELWLGYSEYTTPTVANAANGIYTLDVTDETKNEEDGMLASLKKVSTPVSTAGGHRDGPLTQALFLGIRMINFDADGNLYIGDCRNHCIRMVNTVTMMVSTIIGIPGVSSPFKDGAREEATFNTLHGIVTDPDGVIYVADYHNNRVRRIAIE